MSKKYNLETINTTLAYSNDLQLTKYLVKECGATNLNRAASRADDYDILEYLINAGADNYNLIYYNGPRSYIKRNVLLINKGATFYLHQECSYIKLYLLNGAYKIFEDNFKYRSLPVSKPYVERRSLIIQCLDNYLPDVLRNIVVSYLTYEVPEKLTPAVMIDNYMRVSNGDAAWELAGEVVEADDIQDAELTDAALNATMPLGFRMIVEFICMFISVRDYNQNSNRIFNSILRCYKKHVLLLTCVYFIVIVGMFPPVLEYFIKNPTVINIMDAIKDIVEFDINNQIQHYINQTYARTHV